ncbi:MAG: hypothetical protein M3P51_08940 [Chloroflexota bacterium]|nr:hypothetical protein [Chloroflexota bacterium]
MAIAEQSIVNGIKKYAKLAEWGISPVKLPQVENLWCVPSASDAGTGHLVSVVPGEMFPVCQCDGHERTGFCWHAAAVAIEAGLMPERLIRLGYNVPPTVRSIEERDTSIVRTTGKHGRKSLYG